MVKWEEKCDQARWFIGQIVSDSIQVSIEEKGSMVELWKIIASLYDKFDDVYACYLEKKVRELDPTNFKIEELYLTKLKTLNEKLINCGIGYNKTDTALIILIERKMTSSFDMFIQTRNRALELSQSATKATFDDFCKGFINEQEKLIIS